MIDLFSININKMKKLGKMETEKNQSMACTIMLCKAKYILTKKNKYKV